MNKVTPRLNLSASVISQLARQAVSLVAEADHHDRPADGVMAFAEKQRLQFKGWAFGGWEPPPEPTGIPGL
jgi:hypothetical protein